jgi:hypothetical protein
MRLADMTPEVYTAYTSSSHAHASAGDPVPIIFPLLALVASSRHPCVLQRKP